MLNPPHLRRSPHCGLRSILFGAGLFLLTILTACGGDLGCPVDPNDADDGPGDLQKATLAVRVGVTHDDLAIAEALGWEDGVIAGAEVVIAREGSSGADTARTDAVGTVSFEELLPGTYKISALRVLDEDERVLLPVEEADVLAFGAGKTRSVSAPATEVTLLAPPGRRGSLTISEWAPLHVRPAGDYHFGSFLELYNNSDTTIYLDGKIVAAGFDRGYEYEITPCSVWEPVRNDPLGIWFYHAYAFVGSGSSYPIRPGETAVLATDAIDHRPYGGRLDLTNADFEFAGYADVDNPRVPNLVSVGLGPFPIGHGLLLKTLTNVTFVADQFDLEATRVRDPLGGEWFRAPKERVLDVVSIRSLWRPDREPCPQLVHADFDRQDGRFLESYDPRSVQRRVLTLLPGGRKLLQRTRMTARDFEARAPTPGGLPPSASGLP